MTSETQTADPVDPPSAPQDPPPAGASTGGSFTGFQRRHTTPRRVKVAEVMSKAIITIGGFGTIAAVLMVCVYLAYVVSHLFDAPELEARTDRQLQTDSAPVQLMVDEYRRLVCSIEHDGTYTLRRLDTGELITRAPLIEHDSEPTAFSFPRYGKSTISDRDLLAGNVKQRVASIGFADGSVCIGFVRFIVEYLPKNDPDLIDMQTGEIIASPDGTGIVERTDMGLFRQIRFETTMKRITDLGVSSPVRLLSNAESGEDVQMLATVHADGTAIAARFAYSGFSITSKRYKKREQWEFPAGIDQEPSYLALTGDGDNALIVWPDGRCRRYNIGVAEEGHDIFLAEEINLAQDTDAELGLVAQLTGRQSLLATFTDGTMRSFARAKVERDNDRLDPFRLAQTHTFAAASASPVIAYAPSNRSRLFAIAHEDGTLALINATNENQVLTRQTDTAFASLTIAPKEDALVATASNRFMTWRLDPKHHDFTFGTLFAQIHYEGYTKPMHMWQSTTTDDSSEPKLSFWALIYGTLKGTFYSLLFGVPVALLAAIYTSEFMHKRTRSVVKPTIELMAGLPSVVLGFIGALVIAVWVEDNLTGVLTSFFLVPVGALTGAHCWQLLPKDKRQKWSKVASGSLRLGFMGAFIILGALTAAALGPLVDRWLFTVVETQGDGTVIVHHSLIMWLSAGTGGLAEGVSYATSPIGGWMFLFIPLAALIMGAASALGIKPALRNASFEWSESRTAVASLLVFIATVVTTVLLAWSLAAVAGAFMDPRGGFIGPYVQRNALIVGFVMGFAIIPIIYTIAEDALSTVPDSLRSASLGAGATPWQTAVRIIIPTAMSGLFSAVMIGLGRAVGETMIVLMAAGNTPILEANMFNGFRTLSANIAVELPESVRDSTHYRLLFLSGLVLFGMTFVLNTAAELVRLRFRKKAVQL